MPGSTPKVFVDTNVWFSSIYGSGVSEKIVLAHIEQRIIGFMSESVVGELVRNLVNKVPGGVDELQTTLTKAPPVIFRDPDEISPEVKMNVHKKDQVIFQAAVDGKVDYFVTGNLKDFEVGKLKGTGVKVVSPAQLVRQLGL